jgi:hypothetical protein
MVGAVDAHKELGAFDGRPGKTGVVAGVAQGGLEHVNLGETSLQRRRVLLAIGKLGDALNGMD